MMEDDKKYQEEEEKRRQEEERRREYNQKIQNKIFKLQKSNGQIENLKKSIEKLKNKMGDSIAINDQPYQKELFDKMLSELSASSNEITGNIIPRLYRSMY